MTTEDVANYLANNKADVNLTSSVEDNSQDVNNVEHQDDSATEDGAQAEEVNSTEVTGNDEPANEVKNDEQTSDKGTSDKKYSDKERRDYAFIREKNKRKLQKEKYESRIKELEDALSKYKNLKASHFKDADGNSDTDAYINWKLQERDMMAEAEELKRINQQEQLNYDIEQDRIITERCFKGDELSEYNELLRTKGQAFGEAISDKDNNNVVFGYLETLNEYPVVLRELMTNPYQWLPRVFRSTDPISLKRNIAKVADEILDNYHSNKTVAQQPVDKPKALPITGKQVAGVNTSSQVTKGPAYWNNYLRQHPRG